MLQITISGPAGVGKTLAAHAITTMLRSLGCKVQLTDAGEITNNTINEAAGALHRLKPSVAIVVKQLD